MPDAAQKPNFLESEDLYKLLYEISPEAIIIVDKKGKFIKVNDRVHEWLGFENHEIVGKYFIDTPIVPISSKKKALKIFAERMMGKDIPPYELEFVTKTGGKKIGLIRGTPIRNEKGEIVGDLIMATDITSQKDNQKQYEAILKTSPDAITMTDMNGKITFVSQQTLEIHGYSSSEELLGKSAFDFIAKEAQEKAAANLQKTLTEGSVRNIIYPMLKKDGSTFYGELSAAVIKDASEKPVAFVASVRDVTERIKSEKILLEKTKELERLNKHLVGRELKMAELKDEIKILKEKINDKK